MDSNLKFLEQNIFVTIENSADGTIVYGAETPFAYIGSSAWEGTVTDTAENPLASGDYLLKLKGPSHRRIVFCVNSQEADHICTRQESIAVTGAVENIFDFTARVLEFGDINRDKSVGVVDYSIIKACIQNNNKYNDDTAKFEPDENCLYADGNFDGEVNSTDMDLLFKTLSTKPDDE